MVQRSCLFECFREIWLDEESMEIFIMLAYTVIVRGFFIIRHFDGNFTVHIELFFC